MSRNTYAQCFNMFGHSHVCSPVDQYHNAYMYAQAPTGRRGGFYENNFVCSVTKFQFDLIGGFFCFTSQNTVRGKRSQT